MPDGDFAQAKSLAAWPSKKANAFAALQSDILRLQGHKSKNNLLADVGLELIRDSFPESSFPVGAIHEFLFSGYENKTASAGFIAGLLSSLAGNKGVVLWVSASRKIFPPALKNYKIDPERFVFIDLKTEKDVLWAMDEALKCSALSAVVGEVKEISFKASQRLQLSVEQSQVTGFILHSRYENPNTTACVSRWKISSLPCEPLGEMPGVGFPKWRVELLRVRNGKPGAWDIQWVKGKFVPVYHPSEVEEQRKKTG